MTLLVIAINRLHSSYIYHSIEIAKIINLFNCPFPYPDSESSLSPYTSKNLFYFLMGKISNGEHNSKGCKKRKINIHTLFKQVVHDRVAWQNMTDVEGIAYFCNPSHRLTPIARSFLTDICKQNTTSKEK